MQNVARCVNSNYSILGISYSNELDDNALVDPSDRSAIVSTGHTNKVAFDSSLLHDFTNY